MAISIGLPMCGEEVFDHSIPDPSGSTVVFSNDFNKTGDHFLKATSASAFGSLLQMASASFMAKLAVSRSKQFSQSGAPKLFEVRSDR